MLPRRIGINADRNFFSEPTEEILKVIAEAGFDAVFTLFDPLEGCDEIESHHFAEEAAKNGLYFECVHGPFAHINDIWKEGEDGDAMLGRLCACVDFCAAASVPYAVVHLSSGKKPPRINDLGNARFDALVDLAIKRNVTLAFENQRILSNLACVFEYYKDVDNVRFCWDVGHEKCFAQGREYMPLFGDRLVYTHIHDNYCEDNGDKHLIPFDGKIDFEKTAKTLRESGFSGTLTLETLPENSDVYNGISLREYYRKAYAAALKLRNMVDGE